MDTNSVAQCVEREIIPTKEHISSHYIAFIPPHLTPPHIPPYLTPYLIRLYCWILSVAALAAALVAIVAYKYAHDRNSRGGWRIGGWTGDKAHCNIAAAAAVVVVSVARGIDSIAPSLSRSLTHTLSSPLCWSHTLSLSLSHTHTHTHTLTHFIASGAMGRYTRVVEMGTDREAHTQVQSQGEEAGGVGAYQVRQTYRIVELDPVILLFSPPLLFHSPLNLSICLSVLLYFVRDCCPHDCTKSVKFLPMDLSFSSVGC